MIEFQTGMGGLLNSHGYLNSILITPNELIPYDDSRLDRTTDPMAGVVSYYTGRKTVALHDMEAGEDFFMAYPTDNMNYISQKYNIPKHQDYENVGAAIMKMHKKYGSDIHNWKEDAEVQSLPNRAKQLTPKTQAALDRVMLSAGRDRKNMALSVAKEISVKKKNIESIKENGVCMDNFVPGPSSNPKAGHGAIANRFMMKGDVIAPVLVLQITNRDA